MTTPNTTALGEREAFEAWAAPRGFDVRWNEYEYHMHATRKAFEVWQAATSQQRPFTVSEEEVAEQIYSAMRWALLNSPLGIVPPVWQYGGNSLAQDRARDAARSILAHTPQRGRFSEAELVEIAAKAYKDAGTYQGKNGRIAAAVKALIAHTPQARGKFSEADDIGKHLKEMIEKHADSAGMFQPDTEVIETRWVSIASGAVEEK